MKGLIIICIFLLNITLLEGQNNTSKKSISVDLLFEQYSKDLKKLKTQASSYGRDTSMIFIYHHLASLPNTSSIIIAYID